MEAKDKILAIKVTLITGSIFYIFIYVLRSYEKSFWEIWTILEAVGTILFIPLVLTVVKIMWGVINHKKVVAENEWLITFFYCWIIVVVLSIIDVLNVFPSFI